MLLESHPARATSKGDARRHARVMFSVPIQVHHLEAGGIRRSRGVTLDISQGGLGALVQGELHVGDLVSIGFILPGEVLNTVAVVRHTSCLRSGFEFLGMTLEQRLQIMNAAGD